MKTISSVIMLVLVMTFSAYSLQVMAWVPGYAIEESYTGFTADFGGISPSGVLNMVGLQFWVPTNSGGVEYDGNYPGITDEAIGRFRDVCTEKGIKLLLTIWNSPDNVTWDWNWAMAAYKENRSAFVNALYDECVRLNLDGVDMDFEGGTLDIGQDAMPGERDAYAEFAREMGTKLHENGMIFTICSFHSPCFNAPNMSWWPDWAGYVDYVHVMGYQDNYESSEMTLNYCPDAPNVSGNTDMFKYGWKVHWAIDSCGLDSTVPSMGLGTWLDEWGGKSVQGNIQDLLDLDVVPGVCMWDLQLQAGMWREAQTWQMLKQIRDISYTSQSTGTGPSIKTRGKEKYVSLPGKRVSFVIENDGYYNIDHFDASGRCTRIIENSYFRCGETACGVIPVSGSNGISFLRISGDHGAQILKKVVIQN